MSYRGSRDSRDYRSYGDDSCRRREYDLERDYDGRHGPSHDRDYGYDERYRTPPRSYRYARNDDRGSGYSSYTTFNLCWRCGDPSHKSSDCKAPYVKEVFQIIKDLCFEAKRILEKECDNSLFHERFFGTSVKRDNNALIWKGKMPIGLTVVTAGWDPRATFDEIHAFGSKLSNKFEGIFPFTLRNKSFCLVSCLFIFASKSPCLRLVKAINSGGDIPKDGPCIAYMASKATIEAFKCGVEGGSSLSLSDFALQAESSCGSSTCTTSPEDETKAKTKKTTDAKEKKKDVTGMKKRGKDRNMDGTHVDDANNETSTSESEGEVKMPKVRKKDNATTKDDNTHRDDGDVEMWSSPETTNTIPPLNVYQRQLRLPKNMRNV